MTLGKLIGYNFTKQKIDRAKNGKKAPQTVTTRNVAARLVLKHEYVLGEKLAYKMAKIGK